MAQKLCAKAPSIFPAPAASSPTHRAIRSVLALRPISRGPAPAAAEQPHQGEDAMVAERKWFIRNIAEVPWRQFPDHFGGALSKPLVMPETAGSQHIDYRISMYQPMAHVKVHRHKVQEQIYHVLDGEGLIEIDGGTHVVRKHHYIFLPPRLDHSISHN